jgi:hypothetical protein
LTEQAADAAIDSACRLLRLPSIRQLTKTIAHTLVDAGLEDVEVLLEYPVPLSSYRVDALLAGAHPTTGEPAHVVVDLKQWTAATPVPDAEDLVTVPGMGNTARLHPVAQVRRYCDHIVDFTRSLHGHEHRVSGAAFLYNATDFDVDSLFDLPTDEYGHLFTASSRGAFQDFLKQRLAPLSVRVPRMPCTRNRSRRARS